MARSFDPRQLPAGPIYDEKGRRPFRGTRRYGDLGRVTPGDELENTRDHERIWLSFSELQRRINRAQSTADNIDFSSLQTQIDAINSLLLDPEADAAPPGNIWSVAMPASTHTGGVDSGSKNIGPDRFIPNYGYWTALGWTVYARVRWANSIAVEKYQIRAYATATDNPFSAASLKNDDPGTYGAFSSAWVALGIQAGLAGATHADYAWFGYWTVHSSGASGYLANHVIDFQWVASGGTPVSPPVPGADVALNYLSITGATTLTTAHSFIKADATSAALTITLPAVVDNGGRVYWIKKIDSSVNAVTIDGNASETIDGNTTVTLNRQYESMIIHCDSLGWHILAHYKNPKTSSISAATTLTRFYDTVLCNANSAAFTVTLPAASGNTGLRYRIKKTDASANVVTIDGNASETIDGATTQALGSQWESVEIECDGSNWQVVSWFAGTPL